MRTNRGAINLGLTVAAAVGSLSMVAGCGADAAPKPTPVASYVHAVCTEATRYARQIKTLTSSVQSEAAANGSNPVLAKADFVSFLERFSSFTRELTARVDDAGTPAVSGGVRIRASALAALDRYDGEISSLEKRAQALSPNNPPHLENQAQQIGLRLSSDTSALSAQLNGHQGLGVSQLTAATRNDPACRSLHQIVSAG